MSSLSRVRAESDAPSVRRGQDGAGAAYTVCVRLSSFSARVSSTCPLILNQLASLYPDATAPQRSAETTGPLLAVVEESRQPGADRYWLRAASGEECSFAEARDVVAHLEYLINAAAAVGLGHHLLIHAGAVATSSSALILPGASGQGKSTLVTALAQGGLFYLSDELAVVDRSSLKALPFLKPICLKDGGYQALTSSFDLRGSFRAQRADGVSVCYLPAPLPCPPNAAFRIGYVVLPVRRMGAALELKPTARAQALAELARNSLNLPRHGAAGLEAIARVVEGAACYTLIYDSAPDAASTLSKLVGGEGVGS
jgi:hypothetical protein